MNRNKRILWLLNHTTLREYELPILIELGFEVYTPKKFPRNSDNRSASITYEYDDSLSLPMEVIETLNSYDFYSDRLDPTISAIINKYFSCAIVAYMFPMFENIVSRYKGKIFLRAFGLTDEKESYFNFAVKISKPGFKRKLISIGDRFWFGEGYTNLKEIEPPFIQNRAIHLPVGLPERVIKYKNTWRGGNGKILFVCPDINVYPEAKEAYNNFKANFGKYPHLICGAQSVPVTDDPAVLGYVSQEDYHRYYQECEVMYYHSDRYRHIYYHPAEAVCYGMPLIYMSTSMLGYLGGRDLPGACSSISEAKKKIKKILSNDLIFKERVISSQEKIFNYFSPEYCIPKWKNEFIPKVQKSLDESKINSKIALLPLDNSISTRKCIDKVYEQLINYIHNFNLTLEWDVVIGKLKNKVEIYKMDSPLSVGRDFSWEKRTYSDISRVQDIHGVGERLISLNYLIPDDGLSQFMDCNIWILFGCSIDIPVAPIKPIVIFYKSNSQSSNNNKIDSLSDNSISEMISFSSAIFVDNETDFSSVLQKHTISSRWIFDINASSTQQNLEHKVIVQEILDVLENIK
ncbi:TPA: hypothetical protein ACQ301_000624 [Yersinia enterocolitica]